MSGFFPTVHVIVSVDNVGLRRGFLRILRFGPVRIVTFTLIFTYILLSLEGRTGEAWKPYKKQRSFETVDSAKRNKEDVRCFSLAAFKSMTVLVTNLPLYVTEAKQSAAQSLLDLRLVCVLHMCNSE